MPFSYPNILGHICCSAIVNILVTFSLSAFIVFLVSDRDLKSERMSSLKICPGFFFFQWDYTHAGYLS